MSELKFTHRQISDYRLFEDVRSSGAWNMFAPQAREATGMTQEEYIFVTKNYSALKESAGQQEGAA